MRHLVHVQHRGFLPKTCCYPRGINHLQKPKLALQTLQSQLESLAMSSLERREEELENLQFHHDEKNFSNLSVESLNWFIAKNCGSL